MRAERKRPPSSAMATPFLAGPMDPAASERVEAACQAQDGASTKAMVEALVTAYWEAKTERSEVTRALYRSAVELDEHVDRLRGAGVETEVPGVDQHRDQRLEVVGEH